MKLLVIGDPSGVHSYSLIKRGYNPESIYVWEDSIKGQHCVKLYGVNNVTDNLEDYYNMKFDIVIGNPPYQNSDTKDKSSNLWSFFWVKALELTKENGIVSLITPTTWLSPSSDFKSKEKGYKGDLRLWDSFNRFTSIADIDNVTPYFRGIGSTFGRVTVYKSGNKGLSFTNDYPTEYGFLPKNNIDNVFNKISLTDNIRSSFHTSQDAISKDIRVSIPMTRLFINKPEMIEICHPGTSGTSASNNPRSYYYIHVSSIDEANLIKSLIIDAQDILCNSCRWVGFLNLKTVDLLKLK